MNYFKTKQIARIEHTIFHFILLTEENLVLEICLNRADKKNALHPQMINEIAFALQYAQSSTKIRIVKFSAKGNVFCAGMDLKALKGEISLNSSTVPEPQKKIVLANLFAQLYKPSLVVLEGNVYAGGYFFITGCTHVLALDKIKFSLPEVKRGLFPMQVMGSLLRLLPHKTVLDWCIRGYEINTTKALSWNLISDIASTSEINIKAEKWISEIKANSPQAIQYGLEAFHNITDDYDNQEYLASMFNKTIQSSDYDEGLLAFKEKRQPNWN